MPKETTATQDLINALAEFENVKANKINPAFKARYVSLDALLEAIKPVLHKNNLALIQTLVSDDGKIGVETSFLHASGQAFQFGKLMVKSENLNAQQIGGSITYIKRQSIQTACGISVDLDDDGNIASGITANTFQPKPLVATPTAAPAFKPQTITQPNLLKK
jgi:hypothetical protein